MRGETPTTDLSETVRTMATRLLGLKGIAEPESAVKGAVSSGAAYDKFREFVMAQGGDARALEDLPISNEAQDMVASRTGYVARVAALEVGRAALLLGAGKEKKGDEVDPGAGIELFVKIGGEVEKGQPVARLYGKRKARRAEELISEALKISDAPVECLPAILRS